MAKQVDMKKMVHSKLWVDIDIESSPDGETRTSVMNFPTGVTFKLEYWGRRGLDHSHTQFIPGSYHLGDGKFGNRDEWVAAGARLQVRDALNKKVAENAARQGTEKAHALDDKGMKATPDATSKPIVETAGTRAVPIPEENRVSLEPDQITFRKVPRRPVVTDSFDQQGNPKGPVSHRVEQAIATDIHKHGFTTRDRIVELCPDVVKDTVSSIIAAMINEDMLIMTGPHAELTYPEPTLTRRVELAISADIGDHGFTTLSRIEKLCPNLSHDAISNTLVELLEKKRVKWNAAGKLVYPEVQTESASPGVRISLAIATDIDSNGFTTRERIGKCLPDLSEDVISNCLVRLIEADKLVWTGTANAGDRGPSAGLTYPEQAEEHRPTSLYESVCEGILDVKSVSPYDKDPLEGRDLPEYRGVTKPED